LRDRIGVGLVGFGMAGRVFHAPLLANLPDYELCVVADPRGELLDPAPAVPVVPDLATLLMNEAVDLVVVATPNATHAALAAQAIRAGKHVVVDKPFTPTATEADLLIELARTHGRVLSVFHNRRWDDDYRTVCEVIASGALGRVERYVARFEFAARRPTGTWRATPGPGSGLLFDVGSHLIDQAVNLFGMPETVTAVLQHADGQADHAFVVHLAYRRAEVVLLGSEGTLLPGPTFEVHGDAGSLVVEGGRDGQERRLDAGLGPWATAEPAMPSRLARLENGSVTVELIPRVTANYASYYEALAGSIRIGSSLPVTASEGRNVVRVIEAAHRSSETLRAVRLS
jgi:scyllo-inositol 2-dehydrogenase (NADP+)